MSFQHRSYNQARHWSANNGDYDECSYYGKQTNNNKSGYITEYGNN